MRHLKSFMTITSAVVLAVAYAQGLPFVNAAEKKVAPEAERVFAMVYQVSDLPIYFANGELDASILIAFVKTAVSPNAWEEGSQIAPRARNGRLIVVTSGDNHKLIKNAFEEFRSKP